METRIGRKALAVLLAAGALALVWFCLWTGAAIADTNAKVSEMHEILTALSSARDVRLERRGRDNAENISDNSNRLDALEERR